MARLLLAGSLTRVVVPSPEVEAARELTRAHDACRRDLMNARHRVSKMLLRHGRVYPKSKTWTAEHRRWLSKQQFDETSSDIVFADLIAAVDGLIARSGDRAQALGAGDRRGLVADRRQAQGVPRDRHADRVLDPSRARRRLATFERAPALSAWLGLTPSLNQSGESSHQGAITKTGSTLARRLLVESAWHYSRQPRIGATLANRRAGQPDHILQIANRAQQRLFTVNRRMKARGKPHNVIVVACARQLACFLWAAATAD